MIVFFDIAHIIHRTEPKKSWQLKGKHNTVIIRSASGRKRINIVGALDLQNRRFTIWLTEDTCDSYLISHFLDEIKKTYRWTRRVVHLILDNAKYNRAYETQDHANEIGVELDFLPVSAPNLNIIERFWKFLKDKVCKNKYYKTFEELVNAISAFIANLDCYDEELKTLLNFNFEIIPPNQIPS